MQDNLDYKALLKAALQSDVDKMGHYSDMLAIKALARGVNQQFDKLFTVLFEKAAA